MTATHPGNAEAYSPELAHRLADALEAKGSGYEPRTHHFDDAGQPRWTNRLILEDSPYLLQHAHNPVDWYPWGDEAFERARREDKPIFLSIGYSTCHWCHVMERESFESEEVARWMNELFVCVKVDRERRPDVDELYMTAVQMLTGRGGWPMSSFLTPEGEPFYGGTYFPPPQFVQLLQRASEAWNTRRGEVEESAHKISEAIRKATAAHGEARQLADDVPGRALEQILSRYDGTLGGFGRAPKFPHEPELLFVLDQAWRSDQPEALAAVLHTLEAMALGGIHDQVGGGFHRYSVDARWLVPHFEKMLYNQAHLARSYLAARRLTGDPFFERITRQTLDYVLREMTHPDGPFYSATDADSEGEEGLFFVWTPESLAAVLEPADAELACDLWGVEPGGNFEGHSILFLGDRLEGYARRNDLDPAELTARVDRIRERLWHVREAREHPLRDDKLLTAWNGMMITALAEAGAGLGDDRYTEAASRAAEALWASTWRPAGEGDPAGALWRVQLDGSASIEGLQEDYAYFAEACVALYDATANRLWIDRATQLANAMLERFWDGEAGGFFMGGEGVDANLIARPKSPNDGATPSGNSIAVRTLAQLARRSDAPHFGEKAAATAAAFAENIQRIPLAYPYMLFGLAELGGAAGPLDHGAGGRVRAQAEVLEARPEATSLRLRLVIADGWHVNSHRPAQEELIATEVSIGTRGGFTLGEVAYPEGQTVELGFQDEPLSVYEGDVTLDLAIGRSEGTPGLAPIAEIRLQIQACDDRRCLAPETLVLEVPMPSADD